MPAKEHKTRPQSDLSTVPVSALAMLFHLTDRRVQQLAKEGVIPKAERGRYPMLECVGAYIGDLQSRLGQGGKIVDIREAERRLKTAQAELKERELDVLDGRLIPAEQVESAWGEICHEIRSAFMAIPDDAATGLHDCETIAEKRALIAELVEAALASISSAEIEVDTPTGTPGPGKGRKRRAAAAPSAAETDSESMGGSI